MGLHKACSPRVKYRFVLSKIGNEGKNNGLRMKQLTSYVCVSCLCTVYLHQHGCLGV